jgi:hypothetical protein
MTKRKIHHVVYNDYGCHLVERSFFSKKKAQNWIDENMPLIKYWVVSLHEGDEFT